MQVDPDERRSSGSHRNVNGKACTNCARVKCKCIPRADGTGCERCHRLSKTCMPSAPAKQRGPKRDAGSRSARLEEKLDQLVTLLRAQQSGRDDDGGNDSGDEGFEMDDGMESLTASLLSTPSTGQDISDDPSVAEGENCLQRFREQLTWFAPYVYLPRDMTSELVRQMYPFFWLNIMAVASSSSKTRNSLSLQARRTIIERVVAGGERNFDLLLGLLTFVNWVHLFPMDKQFASLASQLVVSLVWDLGLQMPPPEHPPRFPPPQASAVAQQPVVKERTLEEQRVVLGAFVITSMISQTFKVAEGLRWSAYLDEYLIHVSNSPMPQDQVLVRQVKMQLIINQVRQSSGKMGSLETPTVWVDVLQSRLDDLIGNINVNTSTFGSESTMLGLYHYTTLVIREWIMAKPAVPRHEPDLRRYQVYQRCVDSIKAWLDLFFAMPVHAYTSVSCSIYSQLCYVVAFLHQVTTSSDAAWNPVVAQEVVDLLQTVDRVIYTFEQVKAADVAYTAGGVKNQSLSLIITKFQNLKTAWQSEIGSGNSGLGAMQGDGLSDASQGLFAIEPMDLYNFDILPSI